MYKLNTGDKDNSKHMYALDVYSTLKSRILETRSLHNIHSDLFSNSLSEDDYDELACAITLGDELAVPVSYEEARVLFFALNVNMSNLDSKIRSIAKAYMFYNEFSGDYEQVTFIDTKSSVVHLAKIFYREVVPGITIQYKIPFYVVTSKSGYHFTIAECDKYTMLINDQAEFITRKSFNHLLDGNYAKSFRNHEEVMNSINNSIDILMECILDADFTERKVDFPFDSYSCLEVTSDNTLYAWDSPNADTEHWTAKGNKYLLDMRYDNFIPMIPKSSEMTIFTI